MHTEEQVQRPLMKTSRPPQIRAYQTVERFVHQIRRHSALGRVDPLPEPVVPIGNDLRGECL